MMGDRPIEEYEVIEVEDDPAGQTVALYSAPLSHRTVPVERGGDRAGMMQDLQNSIGVREVAATSTSASGKTDSTIGENPGIVGPYLSTSTET